MDGIQLSLCVVRWWTFDETGSMKGSEFHDHPSESPRLIIHIKFRHLGRRCIVTLISRYSTKGMLCLL